MIVVVLIKTVYEFYQARIQSGCRKSKLLIFRGTEGQSTLKEFYFKNFFIKRKQDLEIGI
jgi:hypothetical protein